jgi:hypothetical protein
MFQKNPVSGIVTLGFIIPFLLNDVTLLLVE